MDFFGDYSIQAASCDTTVNVHNGYDADLLSPGSSETTLSVYSSSVLSNMSDLSRQFSLQSLEPPSPTLEADSVVQPNLFLTVPEWPDRPSSPSVIPCWKRRQDRQRDVRLLTDQTHLRDIAGLVDRMVETGNQCTIKTFDLSRPTDDDDDSSASSSPCSSASSSSFNFSQHRRRSPQREGLSMQGSNMKVHKRKAATRGGRR